MPKISIALFGRNDNYGGNYLEKLKFSIKSIQRALKNIDYEIVMLDYNPPKDKPLLSECLSKFKNIKHVIFPYEDHIEFIDRHLKAGARLKNNRGKDVSKKEIYKINFLGVMAGGVLSVKHSSGDYILSTGTDNIFPIQFGSFINKLESNILYRTWIYRIHNSIKKIKNISFNRFDELSSYNIIKNKTDRKIRIENIRCKYHRKKCGAIWHSSGNFILMDRNSWKETGGYLPTINPRPLMGDCQVIFYALSCGKKVKCVNFPIFNIDELYNKTLYSMWKGNSNYIIKKNGTEYNHLKELGKDTFSSGCIEWQKFRKWAIKSHLKPGKEYFIKINYKKRLKKIKKLFKSILSDKFLLD